VGRQGGFAVKAQESRIRLKVEDHLGSLRIEWLACVTAAFAWISLTNRGCCKT
jgi:hypothetical protein